MSHTTDEEMPSSSPPSRGIVKKRSQLTISRRNQLTKIVSQKFNTDFTEEMLACDIDSDLDKFDESELQLIVGDMKMEYDANGDGIIDDQELNKIIRDAFILGLKNKGLKNDNAVLEKKVDNMSKHVKRNQIMSSVIIVLVMIVTFCATYFGTKASFDQGTVEVKNTITESITTSVGVDTPDGRPHLQDSGTGVDVSTRSYGASTNARNLVAVDGTLVRCLSMEEVTLLAEDVQHGTDVRLSFVDPTTELATETFALSMGDFHDENSYLSFGSDKVRIMLDSDICNQAVAAEEVSSDVVSGVEEPDVDAEPDLEEPKLEEQATALAEEVSSVSVEVLESIDAEPAPEDDEEDDIKVEIELALESAKSTVNGIDSDDSIFDRNLRRQQPAPESVSPPQDGMIGTEEKISVLIANPSSSLNKNDDILKRHRAAYAAHRVAIQSGRQLFGFASVSVPVFNGDQYVGASCGGRGQFCCWNSNPCPDEVITVSGSPVLTNLECDSSLAPPTCRCTSPFTNASLKTAVDNYLDHGSSSWAYQQYGIMNYWCTSGITDMSSLFQGSSISYVDIRDWDVSSVTNMESMFRDSSHVPSSSTSNLAVCNPSNPRQYCSDVPSDSNFKCHRNDQHCLNVFRIGIGDWDVSAVTSMNSMFRDAPQFNNDIGGWDVSAVTNMWGMFYGASTFNQNLCDWAEHDWPYDNANAFAVDSGCRFWHPYKTHNLGICQRCS